MRTTAQLVWDHSIKAYRLSAPYDKAFVEFIKSQIPFQKRAWDPQSREWIFEREYFEPLKGLIELRWPRSKFISEAESGPPPPPPPVIPFHVPVDQVKVFLSLTGAESLPVVFADAKRLYLVAVRRLHPDLGGDTEKARDLNVAWSELKRSFRSS